MYVETNLAFEALTGLKDVAGRRVSDAIPGILVAHPELLAIYGGVAGGGPPARFEMYLEPLGIWLDVSVYHSSADHFVAVFDNISERKRAETMLRESQMRLKVAVGASNLGPWDWNIETNEVYFSLEWKQQIGYTDDEISGAFEEWEGRLHPDDHDRILAAARASAVDPSTKYDVEFRLRHKDGSYRWIQTGGMVIMDAAGRPARMIGCHVDVTDEKEAIAEHERLNETMQLILESTGEGLYGVDSAGLCALINRSGARMLGWPAEDLIGKNIHALVHHTRADLSPYPEKECPIHQTSVDGMVRRVEDEVFWRRDGTSFPISYSAHPIFENGAVSGSVVSFADVTEKLALEAQFRQAQKLEAIGQLTGGVAHDFNNLLTAILGYGRLLEEALDVTDPRRDDVAEICKAGERAAHLTKQLLAFSRRQILEQHVVDLNALVSEIAQMLRLIIGEHIAMETRFDGDLETTRVDPGQIQQVLMNLVVNARDAMPDGGKVIIETANDRIDDQAASAHAVVPGDYVRLSVSDSGIGMDQATQARMFEPFFTTKPQGKGTGLGLSTVYGIVKQSGGFMRVTSTIGSGSVFSVYLPAANGHAPAARPVSAAAPMKGAETILLVEDDATVRALARRMLERQGYRVIEAADVAAARDVTSQTPFDLLLTDVRMPGISGPAFYHELSAAHPGLKVLFMSGYTDDVAGLRDMMEGHPFLPKPFGSTSLVQKVREALNG